MRSIIQELIAHTSRNLSGTDATHHSSDPDLLARVASERDDAAFAAILGRYGRLVWGVCRGSLGEADAEDAFQATFMALFQQVANLRRAESLAAWLHGTAQRIAKNIRRAAARRCRREQLAAKSECAPRVVTDETWDGLHLTVHDEIARLPNVLRVAFILCVLEGQRHADAAAQLGVPIGTLSARVSRAKEKLLNRLRSRGLAVAVAAVAGGTTCLPATVPEPLLLLVRHHLADSFTTMPKPLHHLAASAVGGTTMSLNVLAATLLIGTLTALVGGFWFAHAQEKQPAPATSAPAAPAAPTTKAVDLTRVDRTIVKEAKYDHQPYYALLVFGPTAERRAWLVVDGDRLYVDRNGNGDFTEEGERVQRDPEVIEVAPGPYKGMHSFNLGEVHGLRLRLDFWVRDKEFVPYKLFDKRVVRDHEEFGWEFATLWHAGADGKEGTGKGQISITFCRKPQDAQVCHLAGPLTVFPRGQQSLQKEVDAGYFQIRIATPGLPPRNSLHPVLAPLGTSDVPANMHPVAEFQFAHKEAGKPPIKQTVVLNERCFGNSFNAPVKVPADAAAGAAKVTVSFPAWKDGKVEPATFEVEVKEGSAPPQTRQPRRGAPEPIRRGSPSPEWLPLGMVRTGTIVEASFAVYGQVDDPPARVRVKAPPFVQVVDKSIIDRDYNEGDQVIKGVAGIVVIRIDTSKPGIFQDQIEVELISTGTTKDSIPLITKMPVSVVVVPPEAGAVNMLVVDSPFHWASTADPIAFKEWTDLTAEAMWNVSYLSAIPGRPMFRELDLSKYDTILLAPVELTDGDIKRVRQFVEGGGRLVVAASKFMWGSVEAANKVVDGYGLKMLNEEPLIGPKRFIPAVVLDKRSLAPEVVQAGIKSARFHRASPIVISPGKPARVLVKAVDVGSPKDGCVAIAKAGKGEVVMLGQSLWWSWVSGDRVPGTDNAKLLRWLLTPTAKRDEK